MTINNLHNLIKDLSLLVKKNNIFDQLPEDTKILINSLNILQYENDESFYLVDDYINNK